MSNWAGAAATDAGPLMAIGVQSDVNITELDGVTANAASVLLAVAFRAEAIKGGTYAYSFQGFDPINIQPTLAGMFAHNAFIIADATTGNSAVALTDVRGVANTSCGSAGTACIQVNIDGVPRYIPYW
jgi:hypothetical protein